jgi:hypothetical protein
LYSIPSWIRTTLIFSALRGMEVALETFYLLYTQLEDISSACILWSSSSSHLLINLIQRNIHLPFCIFSIIISHKYFLIFWYPPKIQRIPAPFSVSWSPAWVENPSRLLDHIPFILSV